MFSSTSPHYSTVDCGGTNQLDRFNPQAAEEDVEWLESWAKAVVHASKTDQAERFDTKAKSTQRDTQRGTRKGSRDDDFWHDDAALLSEGNFERVSVQGRRRAMKAAVRRQYAFSTTAQLWVEEITGGSESRMQTREQKG